MADVENPGAGGNTAVEKRPKMAHALAKMESRRYSSWQDRASTELMVVGNHAFDVFSPKTYGNHAAIFSISLAALICLSYAYCAGAFLGPSDSHGPSSIHDYFVDRRTFDAAFLRQWGGLFGPDTRRQAYRLVTYSFIHQTWVHLLGNLLVFGLVSCSLEHRFGQTRVAAVWLISTVGAGLCVSLGRPCATVVGLSGGIFGLLGLFIVDVVQHFRLVRALAFLALVAFEIGGSLTAPNATSFLAHATGFALGLAPSLLVLPHSGNEYLNAIIPIMAALDFLVVALVLPICVFHVKLPKVTCG